MPTLETEILELVATMPGLTDREITDRLRGPSAHPQQINQTARRLERENRLIRWRRKDGLIGNYLPGQVVPKVEANAKPRIKTHDLEALSEDEIKSVLEAWLKKNGWQCNVSWGRARGIDIEARRGAERWIIEVKGPGSRPPMRVNFFVAILGETLQRMDDPKAKYSIALPDLPQYRGLWRRLPALAKERTGISVIFVAKDESIELLER